MLLIKICPGQCTSPVAKKMPIILCFWCSRVSQRQRGKPKWYLYLSTPDPPETLSKWMLMHYCVIPSLCFLADAVPFPSPIRYEVTTDRYCTDEEVKMHVPPA